VKICGQSVDKRPLSRAGFWLPVFIFAAAFAVFSPALTGGFLNWDDEYNFIANQSWRGFSAENMRWVFTTFHAAHYIPLTWLTFAADYTLWGLNPFGYHLTGLILHSLNAVLAFLLLTELFRKAGAEKPEISALWGALFFALHPLRTEAVCWLTARRELTGGLFTLLAALLYVKEKRAWSLLSFFAAVLCRESEAALFPVLFILDIYPLRRLTWRFWSWHGPQCRAALAEKIPFLAVAAFGAAMAVAATQSAGRLSSGADAAFGAKAAQAIAGLALYLRKTFVPTGLSPVYEMPPDFGLHNAGGDIAVISAVIAAAAWSGRKFPAVWPALAVYAAFIFPTLGFARTISYGYDRFSYLSCLGFAALFGLAFRGRVAALLVCALAALSFMQSRHWADSLSLWEHAMAVKAGPVALQNRGQAYLSLKKYDLALADIEAALAVHPSDSELWRNAGATRLEMRDYDAALDAFSRAQRLEPGSYEAAYGAALALQFSGRTGQALKQFENSLANARSAEQRYMVYSGRGALYFQVKNYAGAEAEFSRAAAIMPANPQARGNLEAARIESALKNKAGAEGSGSTPAERPSGRITPGPRRSFPAPPP